MLVETLFQNAQGSEDLVMVIEHVQTGYLFVSHKHPHVSLIILSKA